MFSISKRPTISEIHALYISKKATPTQITQFFFNRIRETDRRINAFLRTTDKLAMHQAQKCEEILSDKGFFDAKSEQEAAAIFENIITDKPLFAIPYSVKDIILVEGEYFSSASNILKGYKAPYSSTVYGKINLAGAILMGINNMDQFAMGASGESSAFGHTRNPFDIDRIPGGSSSGGAAAVGSGQVVFSLGTDTGGSIRQPSAFCDVVGLKPTYGLVSRYGVMPMASSFDQVGAMTNSVEDNIIVNAILSGRDAKDQTTVESRELTQNLLDLYTQRRNQERQVSKVNKTHKPLVIGLPSEFFIEGIDPVIFEAVQNLTYKLKDLGHNIVEVSLPLTRYAISVYYTTMSVEVASNLERIDGIRYAPQQKIYSELFFEHRGKYFGDEPKRRIMLGTFASSAGYYDAYYNQAQKVREMSRRDFEKAFEKCDVILTPTTPEFPFKIGEKTSDPLKMYLSDIFTCGINPARIPGLNVPIGMYHPKKNSLTKLPTGVQILAPELKEDIIYELALEIENLVQEKRVL